MLKQVVHIATVVSYYIVQNYWVFGLSPNDGKSQKIPVILNAIHHHQNPVKSTYYILTELSPS
jgi:hypothetical protein